MNGTILSVTGGALIGLGTSERNIACVATGVFLLFISIMLSLKGI